MNIKKSNVPQNRKYAINLQTAEQETSLQVNVELPQVFTVEDSIKFCLEIFNQEYGLKLRWRMGSFDLYIAKKNGQAKQDLPCLDPEQILYDIGSQLFVIISKQTLVQLQTQPQQQQSQNGFTDRDIKRQSMDDISIKSRTSYTNGLMDDDLKKRKEQANKDDGMCFSCF